MFGRGDSGQLGLESKELDGAQQRAVELKDFSTGDEIDHDEDEEANNTEKSIVSISCGAAFSLAVSSEKGNNLYGWGYGEMGQLASDNTDKHVPFRVSLKNRGVIDAAGGGQHTLLLISPKN